MRIYWRVLTPDCAELGDEISTARHLDSAQNQRSRDPADESLSCAQCEFASAELTARSMASICSISRALSSRTTRPPGCAQPLPWRADVFVLLRLSCCFMPSSKGIDWHDISSNVLGKQSLLGSKGAPKTRARLSAGVLPVPPRGWQHLRSQYNSVLY